MSKKPTRLEIINSARALGEMTQPYKFDPKVRYRLAKALNILERVVRDFDKVRNALFAGVTPPGAEAPDQNLLREAQEKWGAFLHEEIELPHGIGLLGSVDELALDVNDIPVPVLAHIQVLVKGENS